MTDQASGQVSSDRARDLLRLGWAIAELRGRVYFGDRDPGRIDSGYPKRTDHPLPLAEERSPAEQLIQVKKLVPLLAGRCLDSVPAGPGSRSGDCSNAKRAKQVVGLADQVGDTKVDSTGWHAFSKALYDWDADILDQLAAESVGESSAYQLGRALAECSWALDPEAPQGTIMSWEHVLGANRCVAITRLVERVAPALPALTSQAIKGSLAAWERVARDGRWRGGERVAQYLRQQVLIWNDLALAGTDARSLERPPAPLQRVASTIPALRFVWPQMIVGLASLAILGTGVWLLSTYGAGKHGSAVITAIGALGITASSFSTRAKVTANNLAQRLRAAIDADEVARAATRIPRRPHGSVKGPGRLSTPGSLAEPVTLLTLETREDRIRRRSRWPLVNKLFGQKRHGSAGPSASEAPLPSTLTSTADS